MSKILITGGAGFIGSHLADRLCKDNEVDILDDFSTGSIDNLKNFEGTLIEGDVRYEKLRTYDYIFHCAAMVGVERVCKDPERTYSVNYEGTANVLRQAKGARVVYLSTSEVYEDNPCREDFEYKVSKDTSPRFWYQFSKYLGEKLFELYGVEGVVVRLFNTVGPRQVGDYGMVLPRFIKQATEGKPITVYGDGNQTRSFAYIDDVVDALITLSRNGSGIVNVGSRKAISINDLAKLVKDKVGSESEIVHIEKPFDNYTDPKRQLPNLDRMKKFCGFTPILTAGEIIDYETGKR